MNMRLTILFAVVLALLVGCANPDTSQGAVSRPPTTGIDIFRDGKRPTRSYKEIATLTDDAREVEEPTVEAKMIKKAKRMGGSAVIFEPKTESGAEMGLWSVGISKTYVYKARVVVYE
jgi:hypothetical protein